MRLSAYKIAKMKILRGVKGRILVDADHIRKLISKPELFKTYQFLPNEITKQLTHSVELEEIELWNKQILEQIAQQKLTIKQAKNV